MTEHRTQAATFPVPARLAGERSVALRDSWTRLILAHDPLRRHAREHARRSGRTLGLGLASRDHAVRLLGSDQGRVLSPLSGARRRRRMAVRGTAWLPASRRHSRLLGLRARGALPPAPARRAGLRARGRRCGGARRRLVSEWERSFAPLGAIALGLWSALTGFVELLPGVDRWPALTPDGQIPELVAARDIVLFSVLVLAGWLTVEAARRLPAPYTAYAVTGLALPLSVPAAAHPLMSLPRFMLVLFPLWIALALWAREHGRMRPSCLLIG